MIRRRSLLAAPALLASPAAQAAGYPDRPLRLIVPFPPGGGTDNLGRLVAKALGDRLGQTVVVENRGGAGGNIGVAMAAQAAPDGYSVLFNGNGMAISRELFKNPGFNWDTDFTWVARTASTPILLVVNEHVPARTLRDFIAYARANPGRLNHGTAGAGTPFHLGGELFNEMAGTRIVHVPYRGTGPAVAGLLGNEVQCMFASSTGVDGLIRDGKLFPLANLAGKRARGWPQLPSIAEELPGYAAELWFVLGVPRRTPEEVVRRLEGATREMMADPVFARLCEARGFDPEFLDSAGATGALEADHARWAPIIPRAGITPE
jgi:tripartite-type tricarboxylate transporter receptor subunit TctC